MEISRIRALRGPNLWTRATAIQAIVRCTEDECAIESVWIIREIMWKWQPMVLERNFYSHLLKIQTCMI